MSFRDEPATTDPQTAEPAGPGSAAQTRPAEPPTAEPQAAQRQRSANMLPGRERRRFGLERLAARLIATCGVIGIGVALGAILVSSSVQGWITGLVVACVSVILSAILWSSRQL